MRYCSAMSDHKYKKKTVSAVFVHLIAIFFAQYFKG